MNKQVQVIPTGYKTSPLGPIPEDWEVKRLGDVCPLQRGFDLPSDKLMPGKHPVVYSNGILTHHSTYIVKGPGVVTGRSGTIGKVTYVEADFWPHNTSLWVTDFNGNDVKYIYYLLQSLNLTRYASGSGVPTLNRNDLHIQKIALPPLSEQRKIAEILSTWDKAIELQAALIDKLTLRKKGLMQQLLTSRKRLKGFSEPWNPVKLGSIVERVTRKNTSNCSNIVTISARDGFVKQTDFFNKTIASEVTENYHLVFRNEFCYNKSYCLGYPMGAIKRLKEFEEAVVTTLYICFKIDEHKVSLDFIEHFFECGMLNRGLLKVANEGGRAHGLLNVTPTDFFNVQMTIPQQKEQNAIAQVLTATNMEIAQEKQKLEALKQQKKGLMQQLLTGKKRVAL